MTEHWEWPDSKETQSDAEFGDGVAIWDEIPANVEYSITVEHPDYQTRTYAPDYLQDDESEGMLLDESGRQPILHLTPDTAPRYETIIRVTDTSGNSLAGASVTIDGTTQTTSGTGRTTFELREGTYTVDVSNDGYLDTSETISVTSTTDGDTFTIELEEIDTGDRVYPTDVAPLRAFAVGYWPLDEDVQGAEQINEIPTTVSGGSFGHSGIDSRSTAWDAGGPDTANTIIAEGIDSAIDFDAFSTWTISCWANVRTNSEYQVFGTLEDTTTEEYIGIGLWSSGEIKCWSAGHTPGSGSVVPTNEWHHYALSWDGSEAHVWLDGELDYSVTPENATDWLVGFRPTDFTLGTRRFASSGEVDGLIDEAVLFDAALSDEQISALAGVQDSELPGSESATTESGSDITLTTDADIPAGGQIDVTAYEYLSGSDQIDQETVTIEHGHRQYGLESLFGGEDSSYRLETTWTTENMGQVPRLRERALGVPSTEVLDHLEMRHPETSEIIEIPIHNPEDLTWAPLQARRTSSSTVGAFRLVEPTGNPLQFRDPETGDIYGIDWTGTGEVVGPPEAGDGYGQGGFGEGGYGVTDPTLEAQVEEAVHSETNAHRESQSITPLEYRDDVAAVARDHSQNMYEQQDLSHTLDGDGPGDRLADAGISWTAVAENIAWQQTEPIDDSNTDAIATDLVDSWLSSAGHRDNIEGNYDGEGVGVYIDDVNDEIWATAVFISPSSSETEEASTTGYQSSGYEMGGYGE